MSQEPEDDELETDPPHDERAPGKKRALFVPDELGPYAILEEIGAGAVGVTHRGHHEGLGRDVAIKFLQPMCEPQAERRFHLEARLLASLDHPNIVMIHDSGQYEDHVYMVLELVEGGTLRRLLDDTGALPLKQVLAILEDLLSGLATAHGQNVVHRDIKPANLLLTPEGRLKIADFGVAKLVGESMGTRPGTMIGTPDYMAPEFFQISSQSQDVTEQTRCDVYSAGVLAYEMLTGVHPFANALTFPQLAMIKEDPLPDPREQRPDIPGWLSKFARCAAHPDPDQRYRSAEEALAALVARDAEPEPRPAGRRGRALAPAAFKPASPPRDLLIVLREPKANHEVRLLAGRPFTLGRHPELTDLRIDDAQLSRVHCELCFIDGGGVWVRDRNSSNGTKINDRQLTSRTQVFHGDLLHLGTTTLEISAPELTRERGMRCARCARRVTPPDLVTGQVTIVDGKALVCTGCRAAR